MEDADIPNSKIAKRFAKSLVLITALFAVFACVFAVIVLNFSDGLKATNVFTLSSLKIEDYEEHFKNLAEHFKIFTNRDIRPEKIDFNCLKCFYGFIKEYENIDIYRQQNILLRAYFLLFARYPCQCLSSRLANGNTIANAFLLSISQGILVVAETLHFKFVIHKLLTGKIRNSGNVKNTPEHHFIETCRSLGKSVSVLEREKQSVYVALAFLLGFAKLGKTHIYHAKHLVANLRVKLVGEGNVLNNLIAALPEIRVKVEENYLHILYRFLENPFKESVEKEQKEFLALLVSECFFECEVQGERSKLGLLLFATGCASLYFGHNSPCENKPYNKIAPLWEKVENCLNQNFQNLQDLQNYVGARLALALNLHLLHTISQPKPKENTQ